MRRPGGTTQPHTHGCGPASPLAAACRRSAAILEVGRRQRRAGVALAKTAKRGQRKAGSRRVSCTVGNRAVLTWASLGSARLSCLCPFAWGGTERIFIDAHRGMLMQRASCEEAPQKTHAAWVECDIREQRQSEGQCRTEKQTVSFLGLC